MQEPEDADLKGQTDRGNACPHLGIEEDRALHFQEPSRRHRCYLWWQRDRIDLTHQANFCLTESHSACPWLSISPPQSVEREGRVLQLHPEAQTVGSPPSQRVVAILTATWVWLRVALAAIWVWLRVALAGLGRRVGPLAVVVWRSLRPATARLARFLWVRAREGLLWLGHRLAEVRHRQPRPAPATQAEPVAAQAPEDVPAMVVSAAPPPVVAAALHPQGVPSVVRRLVKPPVITWRCSACEAINASPTQVCLKCGRPSPEVEEQLTSSGDELLVKGLAGLKAKNEDLAHAYFVLASEATPESELAWYWRAKTAPAPDEVIRCLECIVALNPGNSRAQADLAAARQRVQQEQAQPVAVEAPPQPAKAVQRPKIMDEMQWWALQVAGICTFALSLALLIPYALRLTDLPSNPQLGGFLSLIPSVAPPKLLVHLPNLPAFDVGSLLPLLLGLLLLHAAFIVVSGGGLGARVWTALLGLGTAAMVLSFGTDPTASGIAVDVAAVAIATALAGDARVADARHGEVSRGRPTV